MLLELLLSFVYGFLSDLFYGYWTRFVAERKRNKAALVSSATGVFTVLALAETVNNVWVAIPYSLGLALGSWLSVGKSR
jgi:hypothetical protein